jgi:ribosomal protein S18 acetylase RimI-like enzyme
MLARAFADDPAVVWLRPDPVERLERSVASFAVVFDQDADGLRLVTSGYESASLWRRSSLSEPTIASRKNAPATPRSASSANADRARVLEEAMKAHRPPGDLWHLHVVGCEPSCRGRGLGAQMVRSGLERANGLAVYLETANERNVGFYRSFGFSVAEEWRLPEGGPQFWSMVRPAG